MNAKVEGGPADATPPGRLWSGCAYGARFGKHGAPTAERELATRTSSNSAAVASGRDRRDNIRRVP